MPGKGCLFMKNIFLFIVLLCVTIGIVQEESFANDKVGTSSSVFLKIPCGTRAVGMGEAYSAVSGGADTVWWNPAGLGVLKRFNIETMHTMWLEDISYTALACAKPFQWGGIGIAVNYLSVGSMNRYDNFGNEDGSFNPYNAVAGINYGKN